MFSHKVRVLIVIALLAGIVYASETFNSSHELDSIGMMQEVFVTAPRYENQDEAWLGMIEGIVVEAQRLPMGKDATISEMNGGNIPANINGGDTVFGGTIAGLLGTFTLILVMISTMYVSLRALLIAEEVEHERTRNRS